MERIIFLIKEVATVGMANPLKVSGTQWIWGYQTAAGTTQVLFRRNGIPAGPG